VEAAVERNDPAALAAALATYQAEVTAATIDLSGDTSRLAHLEEELAKHTAVLTALAQTLPEQSNIENAIDASSKAIAKLQEKTHPTHPGHPPQAGEPGGAGEGQDGNGSNTGGNPPSGTTAPSSQSPGAPSGQGSQSEDRGQQ